MNKKTTRGVYLNTKDSQDYFFVYNNLKFYFSSEFNMRRFKDRICKYTFDENEKFVNKYTINIDLIDYFIFCFYKNIEKRGYKIQNMETGKFIINNKNLEVSFSASLLES